MEQAGEKKWEKKRSAIQISQPVAETTGEKKVTQMTEPSLWETWQAPEALAS